MTGQQGVVDPAFLDNTPEFSADNDLETERVAESLRKANEASVKLATAKAVATEVAKIKAKETSLEAELAQAKEAAAAANAEAGLLREELEEERKKAIRTASPNAAQHRHIAHSPKSPALQLSTSNQIPESPLSVSHSNQSVKTPGEEFGLNDQILLQLQQLMSEKAELVRENSRADREVSSLRERIELLEGGLGPQLSEIESLLSENNELRQLLAESEDRETSLREKAIQESRRAASIEATYNSMQSRLESAEKTAQNVVDMEVSLASVKVELAESVYQEQLAKLHCRKAKAETSQQKDFVVRVKREYERMSREYQSMKEQLQTIQKPMST